MFYYQFDNKDYLQRIYQNSMKKENVIFSREEAVEMAKKDYYANKAIMKEVC